MTGPSRGAEVVGDSPDTPASATGAGGTAVTAAPARRLRGLVLGAYAVNGFALSAWTVRLPAIGERLDLDAGDLGTFLSAGAVGTLVAIPFAGALVQRWGSRAVYTLATALMVMGYAGLAAALGTGSFAALLTASAVHGAAFALTNVPQSVLGAEAERRVGRTVVPQFHAVFSMAAAAGAAAGGLAAGQGIGPARQLAVMAVLVGLARVGLAVALPDPSIGRAPRALRRARRGAAEAAGRRRRGGGATSSVWLQPQTLLLGLVAFGAALSEGAANNWMTPALLDRFAVDEARAALGVSVFLVAQTVGRLLGGPVVDRVGRGATLRLSALIGAAGVGVFCLAANPGVAMLGAAVWGVGAALSVPVAVSLAAAAPSGPARIAAVTSMASLANVAGPPALGLLGDHLGLQAGIAVVAVVLVVGAVAARRAATATAD